jgi:Ca2+-transporting ATPase
MARRPRKPTERLIDGRLWAGVVEIGIVMALLTLFTLDLFLPGGLVEGTQALEQARTACFTVLVLAQLFNCFNARSETDSAFRGLFANRWLWGAVLLSGLLQVAVVEVGVLNLAFGTVPMPAAQWGLCVAIASGVLWFSELRKGIRCAMAHRRQRPDSVQMGT